MKPFARDTELVGQDDVSNRHGRDVALSRHQTVYLSKKH
jgi:hypothetical protein